MAIQTRTVEYSHDGVFLEAFIACDDTPGERPGVLISHAWGGRDSFAESKAIEMARLGYVGFALDMYGKGVLGKSKDENSALMTAITGNRAVLQERINLALDTLKNQPEVNPEKTAAIGFCFGGLCVLDLARSGAKLNAVISFHGLLGKPDNIQSSEINAAVLVLNGYDDPMVSTEDIAILQSDLTASGCDWQLHNFGQTMHAFSNPIANDPEFGTVYCEKSDQRASKLMQSLLDETLA